jgi:predicted nucleotidyltransferase
MGELQAQISIIGNLLLENKEVAWAYLFGSRARGMSKPGSDWDIALWLSPESAPDRLSTCLAIQAALMESLKTSVDVVDLRGATLLLLREVLKRRLVLVDREPLARGRWELKTLGEYFDWLPYHRQYAQSLIQNLTGKGGESGQRGLGGESPWDIAPIRQ